MIFIRVDGNNLIGLGHVTRCLALAHILKNNNQIGFIFKEIPDKIQSQIKTEGFELIKIKQDLDIINHIQKDDIIILDGYNFDSEYQQKIKEKCFKLVCIDDIHDKVFYADLIINYSPCISETEYKVQKYTKFALGLDYVLLRNSFLIQAQKTRIINEIKTVLICFGGADINNFTKQTLEVLLDINKFEKINIVTGDAYLFEESLMENLKKHNNISHLKSLSQNQMLDLYLESDISIVPSSTVFLEAVSCGSIPITCWYVENQKSFHNYVVNNYSVNSFGDISTTFNSKLLMEKLENVFNHECGNSDNIRTKMKDVSANIINVFENLVKN